MENHQVQNSLKNILIYYISTTAHARLNHLMILAGFLWVLENLESPGILLWHFPGEENPGKRLLVLESSGNLLNSSTKIWNVWQTVLRINIEISGVKWLTWNLVLENQSESWKSSERVPVRDFFSGKGAFFFYLSTILFKLFPHVRIHLRSINLQHCKYK